MDEKVRVGLALVLLALLAVAAFYGTRYWQATQGAWTRVVSQVDCDLNRGPCRQPLSGGAVVFSVLPSTIPLMKPLSLSLVTDGVQVDAVVVEIRGLNMDMGLNRTRLERTAEHVWSGETILPVCSQRKMEWEAAVLLEMEGRFEVPFRFHTTRP